VRKHIGFCVFIFQIIIILSFEADAIKLSKMINSLIDQNDCTSIVAVSNEKIAKQFKGRVVKLKFGSIID
jgi:hypothetical protein